nr:DUF1127 domain-containing protein [Pseudomonas sp.]
MKGQKGYVLIQKGVRAGSANASFLSTITRVLLRWSTLYHQRQELARLSDDALKDIGMSRADIEQEVSRPFWYDPMKH